jgi:RimJ/RimL family protein N-acetyltransferase
MAFKLLTSRLFLRQLNDTDAEAVFVYRSLPAVARYQLFNPRTIDDARDFIRKYSSGEIGIPDTWFQLGIVLKDAGTLIGDCGIHFLHENFRQVEIGITLAPAFQGKGYASEVLKGLFHVVFVDMGKLKIIAHVDPRNTHSLALLEHVGMKKMEYLQKSDREHGEWMDNLLFAINKDEWMNNENSFSEVVPFS